MRILENVLSYLFHYIYNIPFGKCMVFIILYSLISYKIQSKIFKYLKILLCINRRPSQYALDLGLYTTLFVNFMLPSMMHRQQITNVQPLMKLTESPSCRHNSIFIWQTNTFRKISIFVKYTMEHEAYHHQLLTC